MAIYDIRGDRPEPKSPEEETYRSLFSELVSEVSILFRQEVALAKAETSEALERAKAGAVLIGAGGLVAFAGLIVLLFSAVYALSAVMPSGWAALIVAVIALGGGAAAAMSGMKKLKEGSMLPKRSAESLKRDADVARRKNHEQY